MKVKPYPKNALTEFAGYHSRWEFVLRRCQRKSTLHLGCIGETEQTTDVKVQVTLSKRLLHAELRKAAADIVGVDYDLPTVEELRNNGFKEIVHGDVEHLERVQLDQVFDVVLCGDLIEHLSCPGDMLEGLKRFMGGDSELIITTPNSLGLLHFLRYTINRALEGNDHVLSFNVFTLRNLLRRHGFRITEIHTCYNRPPQTWRGRLRNRIGSAFFRLRPKFGGTLLVVAKFDEGAR
jgi:SAM-dependent methyltransferase